MIHTVDGLEDALFWKKKSSWFVLWFGEEILLLDWNYCALLCFEVVLRFFERK